MTFEKLVKCYPWEMNGIIDEVRDKMQESSSILVKEINLLYGKK